MSTADVTEPGSQYVDFWNAVLVPKFNTWFVFGEGLRQRRRRSPGALRGGDNVLDVGCGWGETTIEIARRVGPAGKVVGLDCCDAFLDEGRADARAAGLANLTFLEAKMWKRTRSGRRIDFCFSRFGTQFFFENPVAGLRNMRSALKPQADHDHDCLACARGQPLADATQNPVGVAYLPGKGARSQLWTAAVLDGRHRSRGDQQLRIAGYADVRFERIDADVMVGRDVDEAVAFQLAIGPAGEVYREAGSDAERQHDTLVAGPERRVARICSS